jgi:hypothetical protein
VYFLAAGRIVPSSSRRLMAMRFQPLTVMMASVRLTTSVPVSCSAAEMGATMRKAEFAQLIE